MVEHKLKTQILSEFVSNQVKEFNKDAFNRFIELWRELIKSNLANQRYQEICNLVVDDQIFPDYVEMLLSIDEIENLDSLFTVASYEYKIVKEFDRSIQKLVRRLKSEQFHIYLRKWHDYLSEKDDNKNMLSLKEKIKSSDEYVKQMSFLIVKNTGESLTVLVEKSLSKMRSGEAIKRYPYLTSTHELDRDDGCLFSMREDVNLKDEPGIKQDIKPIVDADS